MNFVKKEEMNAAKTAIRDAATLILVARNTALNSHFDYKVLLLERTAKSAFMVGIFNFIFIYLFDQPRTSYSEE